MMRNLEMKRMQRISQFLERAFLFFSLFLKNDLFSRSLNEISQKDSSCFRQKENYHIFFKIKRNFYLLKIEPNNIYSQEILIYLFLKSDDFSLFSVIIVPPSVFKLLTSCVIQQLNDVCFLRRIPTSEIASSISNLIHNMMKIWVRICIFMRYLILIYWEYSIE